MIFIVNYNGDLIQKSSPIFSFDHLSVFNGEVIRENIRLHAGELMYAEKHYFHLMAMMRMARIEIPMTFSPDFFYKQIYLLVEDQELDHAQINFNVSPNHTGVDFWITAKVMPEPLISTLPYEIDQYRETHVDNGFHNRVNFLDAKTRILKTFAFENELQDLVLLNENKSIARTIQGNIFVIKDNVLYVPRLEDGAMDVVSRDMTIEAAKRVPDFTEIKEESIFPFALMKAEEVFVVKDGQGFFPVSKFRKKTFEVNLLHNIVEYVEERA